MSADGAAGSLLGGLFAPDERWMNEALRLAREAAARGEVPVGAVVVRDGHIIATAHNRRELDRDPTAHAELLAVRAAARALDDWRLEEATVVVTLEPCPMCAGALWAARVGGVVFGAPDLKAGSTGSLYNLGADPRLNHTYDVRGGVLAVECGEVLSDYFAARR